MKSTTKTRNPVSIAVTLFLLAALVAGPTLAAKQTIFELTDPRGDDYGDGSVIYPLRTEFTRGELDLVKFSARRIKGGTLFEATFARPIREAKNETIDTLGTQLDSIARYGFYNFNIDIYIDTDRELGSGAIATMPGREAEVRVEEAWDRAIILTPAPHDAQASLERQVLAAMAKEASWETQESGQSYDRRELKQRVPANLADRVFFPTRIHCRGKEISFFVPDRFLGGPARSDWSYVVAVSGADLIQRFDLAARAGLATSTRDKLMIVPVSSGAWQNRFGSERDNTALQPPLIDILVPADASQERVLGDFDSFKGRPAVLPGVVPAAATSRDLEGSP